MCIPQGPDLLTWFSWITRVVAITGTIVLQIAMTATHFQSWIDFLKKKGEYVPTNSDNKIIHQSHIMIKYTGMLGLAEAGVAVLLTFGLTHSLQTFEALHHPQLREHCVLAVLQNCSNHIGLYMLVTCTKTCTTFTQNLRKSYILHVSHTTSQGLFHSIWNLCASRTNISLKIVNIYFIGYISYYKLISDWSK